tara:strand:- start:64 stop:486 length:423 start_codon:yes stop_codon:yes gene_type:complete
MRNKPLKGLMRKSGVPNNPSISDSVNRGKTHSNIKILSNNPKNTWGETGLKIGEVRKDSTITYDKDTLMVDSTPVGQEKVKPGGFGWNAAIKSGWGAADMWKHARDKKATKNVEASNRIKSSESKRGIGGQRPIDPSHFM